MPEKERPAELADFRVIKQFEHPNYQGPLFQVTHPGQGMGIWSERGQRLLIPVSPTKGTEIKALNTLIPSGKILWEVTSGDTIYPSVHKTNSEGVTKRIHDFNRGLLVKALSDNLFLLRTTHSGGSSSISQEVYYLYDSGAEITNGANIGLEYKLEKAILRNREYARKAKTLIFSLFFKSDTGDEKTLVITFDKAKRRANFDFANEFAEA